MRIQIMSNNVILFGDSYSTFKNYVPDGYAVYYSENERPETDVIKVEQTWWHQVVENAELNLILNNSWSGSTIGYTGYNNTDCSKSSSFIYRLKQLMENGFFAKNRIDTVFVFGGTNDSWSNAPLGDIKYSHWEEKDLFSVLPAVCYFLNLLKETLPQTKIYCLINTEIKPEIASCMKNACEKYHITPITFNSIDKKCGHPTIQGMKDIKDRVLNVLNNKQ